MKHIATLSSLVLFTFVSIRAEPISCPPRDTAVSLARELVLKEFHKHHYPGLAVAVWKKDTLLWSEGFGYADIEDSIAVDPASSLFRIGSVSKTLTGVTLAELVEHGQCDLDAPVQKYVPYFPEKRWPISTRQVAQHVAGIRHYRGLEFYSDVHYSSIKEALQVFMYDTLLFRPGDRYSYSSYGWNLISAVVQGASGQDFLDFMQQHIFDPAGMLHTFPDDIRMSWLPRVSFYEWKQGKNVICPHVDNSLKWAGGGFLSTAEDLIRFGRAVLEHKYLNEATTQMLWTPATLNNDDQTNYGLGWATYPEKQGTHWVGNSGGSVGGSTMFLVNLDEQLIVVTLINRSDADAQGLAFLIANQFLD